MSNASSGMITSSAVLTHDSSLMSSQLFSGAKLQPTVIPTLRSQQQSVPIVHPRDAGSVKHESPCITAADKRTNNSDIESISGNTSDQLTNGAVAKLESDREPKLPIKAESASMTYLSPSKSGKSKL